jgi:hypothetical protein
MNAIALLGTVLGLSFTAGINLYATTLIVGLSIRNGWVTDYPEGLAVLGSDPIIIIAGIMYTCEFIADKVPAFDSFWDAMHTFIRPVAGAGLAFAAVGTADPVFMVIMTLIGGGVATATHVSKSGVRLLVNTSPEPVSNSVVSIIEDIGAFSIAYLAMTNPVVACVVVIVLLAVLAWGGPILLRYLRFLMVAAGGRVKSWFSKREESDFLPGDHLGVLGAERPPTVVVRCFARRCGKAGSNRLGYLSVRDGDLAFTYSKRLKVYAEHIACDSVAAVRTDRRLLYDIVEVNGKDGSVTRFLFSKTREPLVALLESAVTSEPITVKTGEVSGPITVGAPAPA